MKVCRNIARIRKAIKKGRVNRTIGFVPTMGALHEGHLSLVRRAKKENDIVVVSVFVNPIQFGPKEDLKRYPAPIKKDLRLLAKIKTDFVFLPKPKEIYPNGFKTYIETEGLGKLLCGRFRPGHFRGVETVVAKLFNIIQPDTAYFGQKDAQQAIIIKKMARDLNFPVEIKVMPIVREPSGLALSSRNVYLSEQERMDAVVLNKALNLAALLIKNGARDTQRIISRMKGLIKQKKNAKIDYISIVDPEGLLARNKVSGKCLIALAVRFGKTRLIDNAIVKV